MEPLTHYSRDTAPAFVRGLLRSVRTTAGNGSPETIELTTYLIERETRRAFTRTVPSKLDTFAVTPGADLVRAILFAGAAAQPTQCNDIEIEPLERRFPADKHHLLQVSIPAPTHPGVRYCADRLGEHRMLKQEENELITRVVWYPMGVSCASIGCSHAFSGARRGL